MKKLSLLIATILLVSFVGCNAATETASPTQTPEPSTETIEPEVIKEPEPIIEETLESESTENYVPLADQFIDRMNLSLEEGGIVLPYGVWDTSTEIYLTVVNIDDNFVIDLFNSKHQDPSSPIDEVAIIAKSFNEEDDAVVFGLLCVSALTAFDEALTRQDAADIIGSLVQEASASYDAGTNWVAFSENDKFHFSLDDIGGTTFDISTK